jgi:hypothetical protein
MGANPPGEISGTRPTLPLRVPRSYRFPIALRHTLGFGSVRAGKLLVGWRLPISRAEPVSLLASDEARSDRGAAADGLYPTVNRRLEWRSVLEPRQLIAGVAGLALQAALEAPGEVRR